MKTGAEFRTRAVLESVLGELPGFSPIVRSEEGRGCWSLSVEGPQDLRGYTPKLSVNGKSRSRYVAVIGTIARRVDSLNPKGLRLGIEEGVSCPAMIGNLSGTSLEDFE